MDAVRKHNTEKEALAKTRNSKEVEAKALEKRKRNSGEEGG